MNEKLLEEIGLTKGEIKVYLTLLRIGETTTGKIIEKAQISGGKVYQILDKLIQKGLTSYIVKEKTRYFTATSPKRILDYLYEKEKDLKIKEQELLKELPSFLNLEKTAKKEYETKLFKGLKGIETAIYEALSELTQKNEVLAIGVVEKEKKYNLMWIRWNKERTKKKISAKLIFSNKTTEYYNICKKMKFMELRVLKGIVPSAIDVMGNHILITTYGEEPLCLSIRNSEIAQSFTTFFYNLWNMAKE